MNVDTSQLEAELITDIQTELADEEAFNANILAIKVRNAIRDVKMRRNYRATSYTEEQIIDDLYNYYSTIYNLAIYDYNQVGMNGQESHNENSISRKWVSRDDILKGVHSFVGFSL